MNLPHKQFYALFASLSLCISSLSPAFASQIFSGVTKLEAQPTHGKVQILKVQSDLPFEYDVTVLNANQVQLTFRKAHLAKSLIGANGILNMTANGWVEHAVIKPSTNPDNEQIVLMGNGIGTKQIVIPGATMVSLSKAPKELVKVVPTQAIPDTDFESILKSEPEPSNNMSMTREPVLQKEYSEMPEEEVLPPMQQSSVPQSMTPLVPTHAQEMTAQNVVMQPAPQQQLAPSFKIPPSPSMAKKMPVEPSTAYWQTVKKGPQPVIQTPDAPTGTTAPTKISTRPFKDSTVIRQTSTKRSNHKVVQQPFNAPAQKPIISKPAEVANMRPLVMLNTEEPIAVKTQPVKVKAIPEPKQTAQGKSDKELRKQLQKEFWANKRISNNVPDMPEPSQRVVFPTPLVNNQSAGEPVSAVAAADEMTSIRSAKMKPLVQTQLPPEPSNNPAQMVMSPMPKIQQKGSDIFQMLNTEEKAPAGTLPRLAPNRPLNPMYNSTDMDMVNPVIYKPKAGPVIQDLPGYQVPDSQDQLPSIQRSTLPEATLPSQAVTHIPHFGKAVMQPKTQEAYGAVAVADPAANQANRLVNQAISAFKNKQYTQAEDSLNQALELNQNDPKLYAALGEIYLRSHQALKAQQAYQKATQLAPANYSVRYAELLAADGKNAQAIQQLEASAIKPIQDVAQQAKAHYMLGTLYEQQGQSKKALSHLQAAAKLTPNRSDVQYNLALAYELSGNSAMAKTHYQQAAKLDPKAVDAQDALKRLK